MSHDYATNIHLSLTIKMYLLPYKHASKQIFSGCLPLQAPYHSPNYFNAADFAFMLKTLLNPRRWRRRWKIA